MSDKIFDYHNEQQTEKLGRKAKESPFMIVGIVGFIAVLGVGAYKFKHRGTMSTSVFLTQLRVISQGTVVGALTGGILYSMVTEYMNKDEDAK